MHRRFRPLLTAVAICAAILLAGCTLLGGGERSDPEAVQAELRSAAEALPEHLEGNVFFQDSTMTGTTISGVLEVTGDDRESTLAAYTTVLETVIRVYLEQPGVGTATVRLEAHPANDDVMRLFPSDVLGLDEQRNVTSDELAEHFGLDA